MSEFNIARKNMIHNQLMTNNIIEDYILKAFEVIPRENFLPFEKRSKAYLDEDIEIIAERYLIEPRIIGNIIKLSKIKKNHIVMDLACSTGYSSAILSKLSKKVYGVENIKQVIGFFNGEIKIDRTVINTRDEFYSQLDENEFDFPYNHQNNISS